LTIGEKVQALRKQRNISQEQLAESMNITRQAVSKWELGESTPDVENIIRLSQVLGVSTDYLLVDSIQASQGQIAVDTFFEEYEENDGPSFTINFAGGIYPIATLVYLFIGFYWGYWHPGWLVFIGAWIVEEIIVFAKTGKFHISIYGIAAAVFLVAGFVFGHWSYTWMVFVLAWVFDTMIVRNKPKKKKLKIEIENDDIHIGN